ncbi:hypothetical protein LTR96_006310 [Exophiala xenobiotica]|nr:hypothetical protein LTR96_006310 [Exophiala xenobiotica]KAK5336797.1 hypothetical protein LTR98_007103 [Exophiala xenobiotica]
MASQDKFQPPHEQYELQAFVFRLGPLPLVLYDRMIWYQLATAFTAIWSNVCAHPLIDPQPVSLLKRATCGPKPVIDCEQFSDSGSDGSEHLCCREYLRGSYPRTIGGRKVDLYRYTEGWNANDQDTIAHLASIGDALEKVIPSYESFGVQFDMVVIFSKTLPKVDGSDVFGYESEKTGLTTPCYVRVQNAVPGSPSDVGLSLEQTIAHETYHCVEDANRKADLPSADHNGWWLEGAAEFYAMDFFPDHTDEAWPRNYDPSIPLYKQSYAVSLFWVFVHGFGWDYDKINNLVFNEPDSKTFMDARKSMAANDDVVKAFPEFAKSFTSNLITYSDGSLVDPVTVLTTVEPEPFPLPEGGSNNKVVKSAPFVPYRFALALHSGQSFEITWKPTDKQTSMFYRQRPDSDWIDITTDSASIVLTCDDDTTDYHFLFTCTADVAEAAGILSIVQTNKRDCCTGTATASSCQTTPTPAPTPVPSPSPAAGDIDACLRATWNVDIPTLQKAMQKALDASGDTISNLKVTGTSTFAVPSTGSTGKFTFDNLDIQYDLAVDSLTAHSIIDIDGTTSGTIVMGSNGGNFVLKDPKSSGQVKTTTTTSLTTDPIELDFDLSDEYGPNVAVSYTCSSSALTMTGTQGTAANGVAAGTWLWIWSFTKA